MNRNENPNTIQTKVHTKKKRKNAKAFACESKNPFEVEHFHLAF